uniref:Uncharacterized protein LOC111120391 n=1 Tax=Crassostrea virginica TaxID=6565 RepID=A0A8B8CM11_CRAVI|nr:uncharacterized protein LOC111120391 [Crassostrea virginica]
MDFCNFAKVIIARYTKDKNALTLWEKKQKNEDVTQILFNSNCRNSNDLRYNIYNQIMYRFPKMHVSPSIFYKRLPRLQSYVTEAKYYKANNKNGERKKFVEYFSLQNWANLTNTAKQSHSLLNCGACMYDLHSMSSLHLSHAKEMKDAVIKCQEMTESFLSTSNVTTLTGAKNVAKTMVSMINPIFEEKTGQDFKTAIAQSLNLTPKVPYEEKRKQTKEKLQTSNEKMKTTLSQDDSDVSYFLSSGKSYSQYERDRMAVGFTTREESAVTSRKRADKEENSEIKKKKHWGSFDSYNINEDLLQNELDKMSSNTPINWTRLAKKICLTKRDNTYPLNAGQVLKHFTISRGINLTKFSNSTDYLRRVRRSKKKIGYRLSVPTPRSSKVLKTIIKRNIQNKNFYIGEEIAPKLYKTNYINNDGDLQEKVNEIHGRKIPLKTIITNEIQRLQKGGVVRCTNYKEMTSDELKHHCNTIFASDLFQQQNTREVLQQKENEWKIKMWHDHSDILNHSYVSFMSCFLYDPLNFLTEEEFRKKYPEKNIDVQSFVEKPQLYIFGLSGSSDKDQLTYILPRIKDLQDIMKAHLNIKPILRVFTGDNPARQFESGQQRGGKYSCVCGVPATEHSNFICCYNTETQTLEERRKLVVSGNAWHKMKTGTVNPFQNLRKEEIIAELESRSIWPEVETKSEVQEKLASVLHGVVRPPALCCEDPTRTVKDLNIDDYEVLACEPLHDLTNVIQNLIQELPHHVPDDTKQEFQAFSETTIGQKNQIKGSDARLYAVKLAKFTSQKFEEGKVEEKYWILLML